MTGSGQHQPVGDPVPGWSPRPPPSGEPLEGRFCTVVPLAAAHAADLFADCGGPANHDLWTYLSDDPARDEAAFAAYVTGAVADPGSVAMAVLDPAGVARGLARYMRIDEANGSVEIGSILWGRVLQRTPAATEAIYLTARHVFDDLGYRRYEWKCDALNAPSRSAALRLGFRFEGVFRNALVYKGRNRDTAWFSITDDDWHDLAPAYENWLAPSNFDADGRQRLRLADLTRA